MDKNIEIEQQQQQQELDEEDKDDYSLLSNNKVSSAHLKCNHICLIRVSNSFYLIVEFT